MKVLIAALILSASLHAEDQQKAIEAEVIVYGATPAGVCAAVGAAREGVSVVLVSPYDYVGGMMTGGLSLSDGNQCVRKLMGGLFVEVYRRIHQHYQDAGVKLNWEVDLTKYNKWTNEPHVAEKVFHDLLREAGVRICLKHQLVRVEKEGARIMALRTNRGVFHASQFIDATYEGDLMA
ncbi:MAG: FAD-dependent oxidoreductase, partial [Roseibacillus sp.]|nr:FAD-dependent oxidoreductase [Roseibacillus sp.]